MSTERPANAERDLGQRFEAENARADIERWRSASDADRATVIAELIAHAERIVATTGIRNHHPAPRLPTPGRRGATDGDGS